MHVNTAINELKVKNYGYNDVKEILESITIVSNSKTRPSILKRGDVFKSFNGKKYRPHVVIKVIDDVVIAIPLSTTEDCINLHPFKSRFFGEGFFSACLTTHCLEEAFLNFAGIMDNPKAVNEAIKKLKEYINTNI